MILKMTNHKILPGTAISYNPWSRLSSLWSPSRVPITVYRQKPYYFSFSPLQLSASLVVAFPSVRTQDVCFNLFRYGCKFGSITQLASSLRVYEITAYQSGRWISPPESAWSFRQLQK